ncbi:MAG: right-handed parallel beta-helix repeat-containing protein, partial [Planctomycetota bacterium]
MSRGVASARRRSCGIGSLVRRIVGARAAPIVTALVSSLLSATSVRADEIVVPDDYFTVAAAVAAAQDGDVVLVRPGNYLGSVDFAGKAITVRSTDGPEKTTLDAANYDNSVVVFANGEGRASILEGFELRNGTGNCDLFFCYGGGIFCNETSPTIRNCIIRDNETTFDGGGLYARRGSPLIEDCVFEGNVASWYRGGAIYVIDSPALVIRRTEFRDNYGDCGGVGILAKETDLVLEDCSFIGNVTTGPGGGVSVESGTASIRGCVFDSNVCGGRGG